MQGREPDVAAYTEAQREVRPRQILALPSLSTGGLSGRLTPTQQLGAPIENRFAIPYSNQQYGAIPPTESQGFSRDYYYEATPPSVGPSLDGLAGSMTSNPKRAYRQRRKDPSCDACRERKVKCDATETTSCTECSSRNVRCQFTKDTNRRMSSIKQVQDLERQLQEVKAQLERLRSFDHTIDESPRFNTSQSDPELPDVSRSPRRMLKARPPHDLSVARAQLSDVGRGLLKPLITPSMPNNMDRNLLVLPALVPPDVVQSCLESYFECVQRRFPILHWPTFYSSLQDLYSQDGNKQERETVALSCTVLGLGALYSTDSQIRERSEKLVQAAAHSIDMWTDKFGLDQGLICFLLSLYMSETNTRSTGWVWLGSGIRIAQDKGLHVQGGTWSSIEGELRKRIWWSFYVCDRLVATELGRPMLINDEDCDTEYPEVLEDEEKSIDAFHPQKPTFLLASIHIARLLAPLAKICKSLCVTADAIRKFESHLRSCMMLFPPHLQLHGTQPLDPFYLGPLLQFQNVRLVLYRHNLSPACSSEQRSAAINGCCSTAIDTASVMSRCFAGTKPVEQIEQKLKFSASFLTCTHLWRCMLVLAFRQQWDAFHVLLRCSAAIDDNRPINISCGRHLDLFLDCLIKRYTSKEQGHPEEDEDLIVLLSGDLQSGTSGWVWGNTESGTLLSRRQKHSRTAQSAPNTTQQMSTLPISWDATESRETKSQWRGWQKIADAARWLESAHQETQAQLNSWNNRRQSPIQESMESGKPATDSRSRMNIANII